MTGGVRQEPGHGRSDTRDSRPRIACVGDFSLGSRRAHAINVVKTAGGFARLGWDVLLLCREAEGGEGADAAALLSAYAEPTLRVEMIPGPDERTHPPGSDKRCDPMAAWAVDRATAFGADVMYSRLSHAAVAWAALGGVAIAETHAYIGEAKPGFQRLLDATRGDRPVAAISTISERLKAHYVGRGADPDRVCVVPDGVDVELFARPAGRVAAGVESESVSVPPGPCGEERGVGGLKPQATIARPPGEGASGTGRRDGTEASIIAPSRPREGAGCGGDATWASPVRPHACGASAPRAVYAGHLYDYKGIPTILDAAAMMSGVRFELIGGLPDDIDRVSRAIDTRGLANVVLCGWVDHADLPPYLWRADVLLLPPSAREASKDWTSPVKLGEYLAAGAPIVASAIPALRDWVDESVVEWFAPDDGADMARAVRRALGETPERTAARRAAAMGLARRWSYSERARAMLRAAGCVRTPVGAGS